MNPMYGRRLIGLGVILLAAALAASPILLHGSFCGDDFEFHVVSWFDVQQSWLHGIIYPHWMASANFGAGEPRFMFYPPVTWILGAALGFVLPWQYVPIALVFLLLAATGLATRALALEVLPDATATLAGCAVLFSGFALFTAYERTAFAELTGGFWIPLLLLFALRNGGAKAPVWRRVLNGSNLPLALTFAGAWLSDGPVGVMASYLLAAVALAGSLLNRSWAPILRGSIAGAFGIGLAAFYLIPAAWEQRRVDLRAAVDYPVFKVENNWLFARHSGPFWAPFDVFLHRASVIFACMITIALLSLLVLFLRYRSSVHAGPLKLDRHWWIPLTFIPAAVLFLQFPISLPVWNLLPKLRFLQYPWRWTLLLESPMAIFAAAVIWPARNAKRWMRLTVAVLCAMVFIFAAFFEARTFLRVCTEGDTVANLLEMYRAGGGLEGTDEYEPPDSDHWKIATGLPDACFTADSDTVLGIAKTDDAIPSWSPEQVSCESTARARLREPEHMRVSTVAPHSGFLILRLLSYPAWRITINGSSAGPLPERDDGLIAVPVSRGPVDVTVDWITTPDVIAGRCVSGLALLLLIALGLVERKGSRARLS
jgi:hypothetical protein